MKHRKIAINYLKQLFSDLRDVDFENLHTIGKTNLLLMKDAVEKSINLYENYNKEEGANSFLGFVQKILLNQLQFPRKRGDTELVKQGELLLKELSTFVDLHTKGLKDVSDFLNSEIEKFEKSGKNAMAALPILYNEHYFSPGTDIMFHVVKEGYHKEEKRIVPYQWISGIVLSYTKDESIHVFSNYPHFVPLGEDPNGSCMKGHLWRINGTTSPQILRREEFFKIKRMLQEKESLDLFFENCQKNEGIRSEPIYCNREEIEKMIFLDPADPLSDEELKTKKREFLLNMFEVAKQGIWFNNAIQEIVKSAKVEIV